MIIQAEAAIVLPAIPIVIKDWISENVGGGIAGFELPKITSTNSLLIQGATLTDDIAANQLQVIGCSADGGVSLTTTNTLKVSDSTVHVCDAGCSINIY